MFDVYRKDSIKNPERTNRGAKKEFINLAPGHKMQQWKKFLASSGNKKSWIKFLVDEWEKPKYRPNFTDKKIYLTCEEFCYSLDGDEFVEVAELSSRQKGADTRILVHASHAATGGYLPVVIVS